MSSENNILMEIIVGTYEKYILGYQLEMDADSFVLKPSFVTEAHVQSVKCVASSNKYLASGSLDETIKLFNMKTRQEVGSLVHHNGTITALEFHESFLISSSEDHTICIWSTSNWECLKTLSGHKNHVNDIAVHPSGKMALSVSKDKKLRTWNLVTARPVYATNIKKVADRVYWSPDGTCFLVASENIIDVYVVENATIKYTINFEKKVCDLTFLEDELVAVGGEYENIIVYDLKTGNKKTEIKAHANRIKTLKCVTATEEKFLVSAASNGHIQIWHIDMSEGDIKSRKIAKVKTGSRPTCMTVMLKN